MIKLVSWLLVWVFGTPWQGERGRFSQISLNDWSTATKYKMNPDEKCIRACESECNRMLELMLPKTRISITCVNKIRENHREISPPVSMSCLTSHTVVLIRK